MIRWLLNIIVGRPSSPPCARECQWEIHERNAIIHKRIDGSPERHVATTYTLRCKTCGDLKDHRSGL